jgi:hypothetical protein
MKGASAEGRKNAIYEVSWVSGGQRMRFTLPNIIWYGHRNPWQAVEVVLGLLKPRPVGGVLHFVLIRHRMSDGCFPLFIPYPISAIQHRFLTAKINLRQLGGFHDLLRRSPGQDLSFIQKDDLIHHGADDFHVVLHDADRLAELHQVFD